LLPRPVAGVHAFELQKKPAAQSAVVEQLALQALAPHA
jgi:hypothetical protein